MRFLDLSSQLTLDEEGIGRSPVAAAVAYPEDAHRQCILLEDGSFWFRHRNDCILAAVRKFPPPGPILDVGGGNGYVTRRLLDEGFDAALLEPGPVGALNAKRVRRIPQVLCATLADASFPPDSLAAVGLFDVLEHIEDDRGMVEQVHSLLQPGGMLYATVPAHRWLWSSADVSARHFRRYAPAGFAGLLGGELEVLYLTCFFGALVPPAFLLRAVPYRLGLVGRHAALSYEAEHGVGGGPLVALMRGLLAGEAARVASAKGASVGTSCLCVARKRDARAHPPG